MDLALRDVFLLVIIKQCTFFHGRLQETFVQHSTHDACYCFYQWYRTLWGSRVLLQYIFEMGIDALSGCVAVVLRCVHQST